MSRSARFVVCGKDTEPSKAIVCRKMIVGPWFNQPEHYQGYNGFVGWAGVCRLSTGRWLLTFNSGYWHASYPWTSEIFATVKKHPKLLGYVEELSKIGFPVDIHAPTGGRCHIMYSEDRGITWSEPQTLVNTELNDAHPTILPIDENNLLCTFFSTALNPLSSDNHTIRLHYMYSEDGGRSWSKPSVLARGSFGNGSAIKCRDGSILLAYEDHSESDINRCGKIGIQKSIDKGKSFSKWSEIIFPAEAYESSIVELANGRLVLIVRPEGHITFSDDGGKTWLPPVPTGVKLFDPHLILLPNGVLACISGSYVKHSLRVILSPDGGHTWHGPGEGYGYDIDSTVYGYSHPMLLEDGSVYLVYQHTGGHAPHDARTEALWGVRFKVKDSADGIEILPAAGSPEDMGLSAAYLQLMRGYKFVPGDPRLGNLGAVGK